MDDSALALKEWASALKALEEGQQFVLMRKGGIIEETKDFRVRGDSFFLYPTYEHQKAHLLKDERQHYVEETLRGWSPEDTHVQIRLYAELIEDLEIGTREELDKLAPFHIWTDEFADERLRWKRNQPLHVLVLRVYILDEPLALPVKPEYLGCKSWVQLQGVKRLPVMKPVLPEEELNRRVQELQQHIFKKMGG